MIEDATASGIPLPHPDNPARADVARIRNALVALDARQVAGGETDDALADVLAAEILARQGADAAEATARASAVSAEADARANADAALATSIAAIPTFNPALYYDKAAVDALIAAERSDELTTTISGTAATVDFTIAADHKFIQIMWDDVSHNSGSDQQIAFQVSTDGGSTYSANIWTGPLTAVSNAVLLTGGVLIWLMSDETAMLIPMQPANDTTLINGTVAAMLVADPNGGRINRVRVLWTAGSFDAGVVRCKRAK